MAAVTMRQLLEAGVHFGHQTRRWNPKMEPFIFGERNGIHIIDLRQTIDRVNEAADFVRDISINGGTVLFVGTKKQAQGVIQDAALRAGMPFVNHRWLGGMLTNFDTIHQRVLYMLELERMDDSGEMEALPKKERLRLRREKEKLQTALGGLRDMHRLPQAMFVVDINTEDIAVREANRLKIPVIAVVDTNCDPDPVDFIIPGNDDAIRAAELMALAIADGIAEGGELAKARAKEADAARERRAAELKSMAEREAAAAKSSEAPSDTAPADDRETTAADETQETTE